MEDCSKPHWRNADQGVNPIQPSRPYCRLWCSMMQVLLLGWAQVVDGQYFRLSFATIVSWRRNRAGSCFFWYGHGEAWAHCCGSSPIVSHSNPPSADMMHVMLLASLASLLSIQIDDLLDDPLWILDCKATRLTAAWSERSWFCFHTSYSDSSCSNALTTRGLWQGIWHHRLTKTILFLPCMVKFEL